MSSFIAFLRGVNMTGHNTIKMADLVALLRKSGFSDAETYIQSGNVVFTAAGTSNTAEIESTIEKVINRKFGYDIAVMVRHSEELKEILKKNPFISEGELSDSAHNATLFLKDKPAPEQLKRLEGIDYPPDKFSISDREIFIFCPNGFGKTKLYTNFFENKLKIKGTARNLKTISTLIGMAEEK
jgi:uncharacterized protein (DUF1697 family)